MTQRGRTPNAEPRAGSSRRRSRAVDLAILGTAGGAMTMLGGCSNASFQRNVYKSFANCVTDYSERICAAEGAQGAGRFLGPTYRVVDGRPTSCRSGDPGGGPSWNSSKTGTQPVERGGFGTSCPSGSSRFGSSSSFSSGGG